MQPPAAQPLDNCLLCTAAGMPWCQCANRINPIHRYREALSAALEARQAEVVVSVLEELAARDGLDIALGGRDAASLAPLLRFLCRHVTEPRYSKLLCSIAHRVLDLYASVVSLRLGLHGPMSVVQHLQHCKLLSSIASAGFLARCSYVSPVMH